MTQPKPNLVDLATQFVKETEKLTDLHCKMKKYQWKDPEYRKCFNCCRAQEYVVSQLYKDISKEKTRLWNESKQP